MSDELAELQRWYASYCNGDWEHDKRIEIGTLDNPGWRISINLEDTELEGHAFAPVQENYEHESEWLGCWVSEGQFHGAGGPFQLPRMLRIFLDWAGTLESSAVPPEQPGR
jgi:hypothetical protein